MKGFKICTLFWGLGEGGGDIRFIEGSMIVLTTLSSFTMGGTLVSLNDGNTSIFAVCSLERHCQVWGRIVDLVVFDVMVFTCEFGIICNKMAILLLVV